MIYLYLDSHSDSLFTTFLIHSCHCLPSSIMVGTHEIMFSNKVRNLGFILDSNLTMEQHVIKTCQTAYYELKRISSIRRYLTEDAAKQLVTSCVLSRLDYCNSLLVGTPNSVIQPMQKVQNTAARLILRAPRHQNCTPLLQQLHWLPVSERIKYKTARVTTQSQVPLPLIFLSCYTFTVLPALSALRQTHACSKSNASAAKPMAFALSHTLAPTSGTISPKTSGTLLLFLQKSTQHFEHVPHPVLKPSNVDCLMSSAAFCVPWA